MKAVVIRTFGSPRAWTSSTCPCPFLLRGQERIATEAIGVGGVEAVIHRGTLAAYGFRAGHLVGSEVAGSVTAVGEGVDASWIGPASVGVHRPVRWVCRASRLLGRGRLSAALRSDRHRRGDSRRLRRGRRFSLSQAHFTPGETVLVSGAAGTIGITTVRRSSSQPGAT